MKTLAAIFAFSLWTLAGAPVPRTVGEEGTSAEQAIVTMGFLAGNWSGSAWGGEFGAYYTTPEGGKVLSYSELSVGGKVVYHEFEKFEVSGGKVVFTPFPKGKPANPLTLSEIDATQRRVTFENPDKDFPTRIVYHRVTDDNLVITLSDPFGGSDKVETFDLRRRD